MDTPNTPDTATTAPARRIHRRRIETPMVDTVRDWIVQQTGWRNLRDIDEEERLRMGANALALLRGWIGSSIVHGGTPLAEVVEALELVDQVLAPAPPPPPVDIEREVSSRLT